MITASLHTLSSTAPRSIWAKLLIPALALAAAPAAAQHTIDISGLESWGLDGDPDNELGIFFPGALDPDLGFIILEIRYDITIQTLGSSLLSDVTIRFGNSDGTFDGNWPDTFVPGAGFDFSGAQRFTGSFQTDLHLNADGQFHVQLFELFDDNPSAADAVLLPGSVMSFGRFIPAPGAVSLLALGALPLAKRRRR